MAGLKVSRDLLDTRSAQAVLAVRTAFEKVETLSAYLATVPSDAPGGDPLTDPEGDFKYTADEAYLIRFVMGGLNDLDTQTILDAGRQLTGLE